MLVVAQSNWARALSRYSFKRNALMQQCGLIWNFKKRNQRERERTKLNDRSIFSILWILAKYLSIFVLYQIRRRRRHFFTYPIRRPYPYSIFVIYVLYDDVLAHTGHTSNPPFLSNKTELYKIMVDDEHRIVCNFIVVVVVCHHQMVDLSWLRIRCHSMVWCNNRQWHKHLQRLDVHLIWIFMIIYTHTRIHLFTGKMHIHFSTSTVFIVNVRAYFRVHILHIMAHSTIKLYIMTILFYSLTFMHMLTMFMAEEMRFYSGIPSRCLQRNKAIEIISREKNILNLRNNLRYWEPSQSAK